MESLGDLERTVMRTLWNSSSSLTATELRGRVGEGERALTTIHTVLSRLEKKGFVRRDTSTRPHVYRAVSTAEEHTAELMREVLDQAPDRRAVLAHFLGSVSHADTAYLSSLLKRRL